MSSGLRPSGLTEATGLAGSVVVQVGFAVSGSSVFLGNPFWAGFDLRLKADSLATENWGLFWERSLLVHWFESGPVGLLISHLLSILDLGRDTFERLQVSC